MTGGPVIQAEPGKRIDGIQLDLALRDSPAFRSLPVEKQEDISHSLARVLGFLATPTNALAEPLAGLGPLPGETFRGAQPGPGASQQPVPTSAPQPAEGQTGDGGGNSFDTASGATAAMLGAIAFPDFVASLIKGTFQAIVDSSIQQMEAYSALLAETAKTVDTFMADHITDDMARDHLVDNYGDVFAKDLSAGSPQLHVDQQTTAAGELPSFLQNLGFDSPMDIDQQSLDDVVIPRTRRTLAEMRHQSLATMVMMGINRIVVSDGEINAKLVFHIDAAESMSLSFTDYKPTNWNLAGQLGKNAFGASGVVVNTTSLNAQTEVNMRTDLTGEVRVRFRSDYFPLERFADSAAIQLINSHARVPEPRTPEQAAEATPIANIPPPPPPALPSDDGGS